MLGGTFDPPHAGHLFINKDTLKRFNLDYIWWIVTKQNTLKENKASDFNHRIDLCKEFLKKESKILVLDIEKEIKSTDTIDVLNFIIQNHTIPILTYRHCEERSDAAIHAQEDTEIQYKDGSPRYARDDGKRENNKNKNVEWYWITGSDSFHAFNQWPKWQKILQLIKIIVYDRANFLFKESKINSALKKYRTSLIKFQRVTPPSWTLVKIKAPNISSTEIRYKTK